MSVDLLENCDDCFQACLSELPENIVIKGGLTATTNYYIKVIDKFNNKFTTPAIASDGAGSLHIAIPDTFPAQWLNRNAGKFKVKVSKTLQPWTPESMTLGGSPFSCILVEFVNDDTSINTIQ